jgi:hypothetical protein
MGPHYLCKGSHAVPSMRTSTILLCKRQSRILDSHGYPTYDVIHFWPTAHSTLGIPSLQDVGLLISGMQILNELPAT